MKFREVERNIEEERLNKEKEEEGFKKIKPETNITIEEARSFIEDLFYRVITNSLLRTIAWTWQPRIYSR